MNFIQGWAHEWLATQSEWWWPRLADHLWQSTIFVLLLLATTFFLRRGSAKVRHSLWMLASLKLLIPTTLIVVLAEKIGVNLVHLVIRVLHPREDVVQGISEPITSIAAYQLISITSAQTSGHFELYCALTVIWMIGCFAILGWATKRRRRFARALKMGRKVTSGREWEALLAAKVDLGMTASIDLVLSPHRTEPTVGWVWRPVVMLPESIGDHLDDRELEAIMLHELVHVQRHDNLIGNLQLAVLAVFWFYPLVWFISRKLINEREQACDERVLQAGGMPEAYASSILKVVRFSFGWKMAGASGAGNGSNLRRRVKNIMTSNNARRSTGWSRGFAGTLMGLALVLMVVAGVNTRARALSSDFFNEHQNVDPSLSMISSPVETQKTRARTPQPPPAPPQLAQPAQPEQPPAPPQPLQPTNGTQPATPAQPAQPPSPPSQPAQGAQLPPSPPSAPAAASPVTPPTPVSPPRQEGTEKGALIVAPHPVYPDSARKDQITGTVSVQIVIGEDGSVISAKADSGPEPLRASAVDAAYKARFKPAKANGKPAKRSAVLSYDFKLQDPDC